MSRNRKPTGRPFPAIWFMQLQYRNNCIRNIKECVFDIWSNWFLKWLFTIQMTCKEWKWFQWSDILLNPSKCKETGLFKSVMCTFWINTDKAKALVLGNVVQSPNWLDSESMLNTVTAHLHIIPAHHWSIRDLSMLYISLRFLKKTIIMIKPSKLSNWLAAKITTKNLTFDLWSCSRRRRRTCNKCNASNLS